MDQLPSKHHYIPEFYLNNFTDDAGQFFIYLVNEKRFKKNGRPFAPSSHFFVPNGNTVESLSDRKVFIESDYAKLDSNIAKVIYKIKTTSNEAKFGLTNDEIVLLNYFFAQLYWRNPKQDALAKDLIRKNPLNALGLTVVDEEGNETHNAQVNNFFMNNPDIFKLVKYSMPLNMFKNAMGSDKLFHIIPFPTGNLPCLLGDNPIIFRNSTDHNTYVEDIVVPITKDLIFIRAQRLSKFLNSTTKVLIDLLQLRQASQFVCCTNKSYIDQLQDLYDSKIKTDEILRQMIFYDLADKDIH